MSVGLLSELLSGAPAGHGMQVVMISRKDLIRNPDNKIYLIGDVSRLKEDIRTHGIRQPLEVVEDVGGKYKLIGGERRLTACEQLAFDGDDRFDELPCIILQSKDPDEDKIALITANATARELTDGERLAQYEALKEVLERKKQNGQLTGKVRDELCRILGLSTGAAARLNAISNNCGEDIKAKLRIGELTLTGAYRIAQTVIADSKMPAPAKQNPEFPVSTVDTPETLPEESVFEPDPAKEIPYVAPEKRPAKPVTSLFPDWVRVAAEEIINKEWVRDLPDLSPIYLKYTEAALSRLTESLDCGATVEYSSKRIVIYDYTKDYQRQSYTWMTFTEECRKLGLYPYPVQPTAKPEPQPEEKKGKRTLDRLARETLKEDTWELDRNIPEFGLGFYKKPLPGGATLWRLDDTQRDAAGLAPGEHTRYAIIECDSNFFTVGWEQYNDAVESLVRYFDLA